MQPGCPEVRLQLHEVNVSQALNSFQFQDELLRHNEVYTCIAYQLAFEQDPHWKLRLERYRTVCERDAHGGFVDRLEKTRA